MEQKLIIDLPLKKILYSFLNLIKIDDPLLKLFINQHKYINFMDIHQLINTKNENIYGYFYLSLLIYAYHEKLDYFDLIINILKSNNYKMDTNNEILKRIVKSKVIIQLINEHSLKNSLVENEIVKNEFEKIKNDYNSIIKSSINYLKENNLDLNIDDILSLKIEELYLKIIITIIKNNELLNDENIFNILYQLELDKINISETMLKKLSEFLKSEDINIKQFIIRNIDDLFNIKKIYFYYFLLKFIFKNSIQISNIPFLLETRKNILYLIKRKSDIQDILYSYNLKYDIVEKIEFILKKIIDSEYYFEKYFNYLNIYKIIQLKEVLKYYKQFLFYTKKEDIYFIENIILSKKKKICFDEFLKDFDLAKKMNEKINIIKNIYKDNFKNLNSEEEINKILKLWEKLKKLIKDKQFKKLKKNIKIKLANYFADKNNKEEIVHIFDENIYEFFYKNCIEFIKEETNKNQKNNNTDIEKIINIKGNSDKDNENKKRINLIKGNDSEIKNENTFKKEDSNISIDKSNILKNISTQDENNLENEFYEIKIEFIKNISKHQNRVEFIKELNNEYLISGGGDKELNIYDKYFNKLLKITSTNLIYNFYNFNKYINNNIIIVSKDKLFLYDIKENKVTNFNKIYFNNSMSLLNFSTLLY